MSPRKIWINTSYLSWL